MAAGAVVGEPVLVLPQAAISGNRSTKRRPVMRTFVKRYILVNLPSFHMKTIDIITIEAKAIGYRLWVQLNLLTADHENDPFGNIGAAIRNAFNTMGERQQVNQLSYMVWLLLGSCGQLLPDCLL